MSKIPESAPGHFATADGREMLERYADKPRDRLAGGHYSDTEVAGKIAMLNPNDAPWDFEGTLAIGRDRIRWLSAQLLLANAARVEQAKISARALALLELACAHLEGWSEVAGLIAAGVRADVGKDDPALAFLGVPLDSLLTGWEAAEVDDAEGWGLFNSGYYGWQIERDDEAETLADDDAAIAHVRAQASAGSPTHQLALAIHLTQEAANKAACEAAGYKVHPGMDLAAAPPVTVWAIFAPNGRAVCLTAKSPTQAWAYAQRDFVEQGDGE